MKKIRLKTFRFLIRLLCRIFGYGGVIYNVIWRAEFADLVDPECNGKITAMNNTIRLKGEHSGLRLRQMTKKDHLLLKEPE